MSTPNTRLRLVYVDPQVFDPQVFGGDALTVTQAQLERIIECTVQAAVAKDGDIDPENLSLYIGPGSTAGRYRLTGEIDMRPNSSLWEFVHTLVHELRHRGQHVRGESPEDYISYDGTNMAEHRAQPCEVDADEFGEWLCGYELYDIIEEYEDE